MAIETICKGCARKLRVGDESAGKTARCPHCRTTYTVPGEPVVEPPAVEAQPATDDTQWEVQTPDGSFYGPVPKSELDEWVAEGRVPATAQVRRVGHAWQFASSVFPEVGSEESFPTGENPFAEAAATNPYRSAAASPRQRHNTPHRGGLVLALGIAGICCGLLAPVAWIIGHQDMRAIDAGMMDPGGRGLTQAGMILGIIGTILLALSCGMQMLAVVG